MTRSVVRRGRRTVRAMLREFPAFLRLLGGLFRDPRVPGLDKALVAVVLVYLVTPTDLLPDFLGLAGFADDFFLLGLALHRLVDNAGPRVVKEHWSGSRATLRRLVRELDTIGAMLPGTIRRALGRLVARG